MGNIRLVSSRGSKGREQKNLSSKRAGNAEKPQRTSNKKKRSAFKTFLVILLIIIIGVASAVIALGFHVRGLDTVFPNVWADGVNLSGLTFEEAVDALIAAGYENNADEVSVTVNLPNDISFTLTGNDVGFALSAAEAAEAALQVGRNGAVLESEFTFIRSHITRTDLRELSRASFDEEYVRGVVAEYTKMFNLSLMGGAYSIGSESITVETGTGIMSADEESVFNLTTESLFRALDEHAHLTVFYTPEAADSNEVDIQLLFDTISVEPVSSVYDPETFSATPSSSGITFDLEQAQAMLDSAGQGGSIVIPLIFTEPEMTQEALESMLFRDVLGERTTNVGGTAARRNNVELAGLKIDGTVLNPGEVFSFNQVVGRRTAEGGFQMAGAFSGGRLVDVLGGGICQTSSTLYYATLQLNLEIVERREHGLTVSYLPLGHDATISWGDIDFRFRNNRDFPIRIEIDYEDHRITARIVGTRVDEYTYTSEFRVISSTPFPVIRQEDPSIPPGQTRVDLPGSTGYLVEVFLHRVDGEGNVVDSWSIGRSRYNVQNRVILVPPEPEQEDPDAASGEQQAHGDTQTPGEQLPPQTQDPPTQEPPVQEQHPETPPSDWLPTEDPPVEMPAEQLPPQQPSSNEDDNQEVAPLF